MPRRLLFPNLPGGVLSPVQVSEELTAAEELLIENLEAGTYQNVTPTGTVNGVNTTFTLPAAPSPANSLKFYVNGQLMAAGGEDYTLASATITTIAAPPTGSVLRCWFLRNQ